MASNRLIKSSLDNYKNAPISSWILGLTAGILIVAFLAIDLVVPGLCLILFPFVIMPIIFSASLQHIIFKTKGQLTLTSSLKSFGYYYNPRFFGSFSIITSFLKGLLVFLSFEMIISFSVSTIFQATDPSFVDSVEAFYALINNVTFSIDEFNNVLYMNNGILFRYISIVMFPSLYLGLLFMLYNMSRASIVIYYKMQVLKVDSRFAKFVYADVVRHGRMKMFKDYMTLNWPLYVLLAAGFIGGTIGGYLWKHELFFMMSLGLVGGAALAMLFFPFYFGNQEVLFEHYAERFAKSTNNVTNFLLQNLQNNIDLSIEEKKKIENDFSKANNPLEDDSENDNKKDPDRS